jgi:hypothetical protein
MNTSVVSKKTKPPKERIAHTNACATYSIAFIKIDAVLGEKIASAAE